VEAFGVFAAYKVRILHEQQKQLLELEIGRGTRWNEFSIRRKHPEMGDFFACLKQAVMEG
jgi:hypothetical protein